VEIVAGPNYAAHASPIVAATHGDHSTAELVQGLEAREVIVADRGGRLRVAPHFYNSDKEIGRMLAAIAEQCGRKQSF